MLLAYDRFLHRRAFNPLIRAVQRHAHVNRWDLLRAADAVDAFVTGCALIASVALSLWGTDVGVPWWFLSACFLVVLGVRVFGDRPRRLRAEMARLAERFEEGERCVPSEELLMAGVFARGRRRVGNAFATGLLCNLFIACAFVDEWLVMFFWACFTASAWVDCLEGHLWDADDVPPDERFFVSGRAEERGA